jgi:hypothetical protein
MICEVPPGMVAESGSVVQVASSHNAGGVILGYLSPAAY